MKYIITGGAGYLGSVLAHELERRGYGPLKILVLPGEKIAHLADLNAEIVRGDILDLNFLDDFIEKDDIVFHLAGIVNITASKKDLLYQVNVEGFKNIVDTSIKKKIKRLIYTSSVHAILPKKGNEIMQEPDSFSVEELVGDYAKTKALATKYLFEKTKAGEIDAVALYPSGIIGPYDYNVSHFGQVILDYINRKLTAIVKGGYDFVDVRDVASALVSAIDARSGEGYIVSGHYVSVRELFKILNEKLDRKRLPGELALWFLKIVAPLAELHYKIRRKKPLFNAYTLYTLNVNCNFDNSKARAELGFNPRSVKESLFDMVDWFLENKQELIKRKYLLSLKPKTSH
ncbi:MAG: NAD-dependent epimerase/dehydratase family protein [Bacilli bacterium]|jgi:dihydroflavonol-4-reductase